MSEELPIANLVLGIIGTVTGIIALFISYWMSRKENPRLKITIESCSHNFTPSTSQIKTILFWTKFQIKNQGDRGTRINDVGLMFEIDGKTYQLKKKYFREEGNATQSRWIEAHDIVDIDAHFFETFEGSEKELIDCVFTIYHTHGAKDISYTSKKTKT